MTAVTSGRALRGSDGAPALAEGPCPSCTALPGQLEGAAEHVSQRVNLAVVGKAPLRRILAFADERGWRRLRLLSSARTTYNRDYFAETAEGHQRELPRWREYKARDAFLSARISRVAFGTDDRNDVAKYVIAVEVPGHAAHSEHDADPGFQEFNHLADLLQPEDPLVYGGEVLHAV